MKIGISIGDLNGIGLEIVFKTFLNTDLIIDNTVILFASSQAVSSYLEKLSIEHNYNSIEKIEDALVNKISILEIWKESIKLKLGTPSKATGKYAVSSFMNAVKALKNNKIDILVTAPIDKNTIQTETFYFPGHTDYLKQELQGSGMMLLMTDSLRVGLVTDHLPIRQVADAINIESINTKAKALHKCLKQDFAIKKPKIAILGLNPHCGDGGVIGSEDNEIVIPAIKILQEQGINAFGPFPADSFFGSNNYKNYDAILAMYHDQGLGPFKTLSFGKGVNYTAGLNKIRTSPDHGTAYDIAGKGIANAASFKAADQTAIQVFENRKS
jgi:4-hydroxythreonine-4-phosphate dehydrogenase